MQPNLRRFLPLILIAFFLLIVLPSVLKKGKSTGSSPKTLSLQTIAAMSLVDRAEVAYKSAHGSYSAHVADLLALNPKLGADLVDGVTVGLDVSTNGQGYFGQVGSTAISLVRDRQGAKVVTHGCVVVKSGSGVACPVTAAAKPAAAGATTTGATTGG